MARTIPRRYVDNYTKVLEALSEKAQAEAAKALAKIPLDDVAQARDNIILVMDGICGTYADSTASVAAKFYEICREHCIGGTYEALIESGREPEGTHEAVRAMMQTIVDGKPPDALYDQLLSRVDYEIRRAAGECTFINMQEDPY